MQHGLCVGDDFAGIGLKAIVTAIEHLRRDRCSAEAVHDADSLAAATKVGHGNPKTLSHFGL